MTPTKPQHPVHLTLRMYQEIARLEQKLEEVAVYTRYVLISFALMGAFYGSLERTGFLLLLIAAVGFFLLLGIRLMLVRRRRKLWRVLKAMARHNREERIHDGRARDRTESEPDTGSEAARARAAHR